MCLELSGGVSSSIKYQGVLSRVLHRWVVVLGKKPTRIQNSEELDRKLLRKGMGWPSALCKCQKLKLSTSWIYKACPANIHTPQESKWSQVSQHSSCQMSCAQEGDMYRRIMLDYNRVQEVECPLQSGKHAINGI